MTSPTASLDEPFSSERQLAGRTHLRGEKTEARSMLMRWVLVGYFLVLTLSIAVPFVVARLLSGTQVDAFKETMLAMGGLSQGLFGILGVVVGFYFKQDVSSPESE